MWNPRYVQIGIIIGGAALVGLIILALDFFFRF